MRTSLVLLGMKHSGKSTLGRLYAQREHLPFYDLDDLLAAEHGAVPPLTPREIMKTLGKAAFQEFETKAAGRIAEKLAQEPGVLALGGGTITNPEAMAALTGPWARLVYLQDSAEVLFERIMRGGLPAFLDPADPWTSFQNHYSERTKLMEAACSVKLDLRGKNVGAALETLITTLKETPHAR